MRTWLWPSRPRRADEEITEEIRAHLAIAIEERIAEGLDPEEARYAALREFGNVTLATEATRSVWTPRWLNAVHDFTADVRYGVRTLAKNQGFALTVIAVLTLGVGLNAAVFTMLKSIVLSPVAGVDGSARLAVIVADTSTGRPVRISYPDYQYLRDHDRAFSGLFGTAVAKVNLGRGRGARQLWGELVSGNYFQVLGVDAQLGRTLMPSDEAGPGRHPVVVISDALWRREFAAAPDIVGRMLEVNNHQMTVVGVADAAFHGTTVVYDVELFLPVTMAPQLGFTFGSQEPTPSGILSDRNATVFFPQGYLRPGTTMADAVAQTDALWAALSLERGPADSTQRLRIVPFWQTPAGAPTYILPTLVALSAMGLLVLAIACANIAGLVLVRGVSRRGEIALRLALGARRARIVRLLVVENLVLAVPGAVLGVLLAQRTLPVLVRYAEWLAAPQRLFFNIEVDGFVIGYSLLAACGSAVLFGFLPAVQSSRVDLVSVINEDASPRSASRGRFRAALVVAQVAVSVLLLVGAGLAMRSVEAARRANLGFEPTGVTAVTLDVRQNGYDERRGRAFYVTLLEAARADPGVEAATLAVYHPMAMQETRVQRVHVEGYESRRGEDLAFMSNAVGADYLRTLRIPMLAGREFDDRDDETGAPVVVVNATLAQRFWGAPTKAVGRRISLADGEWRTVVGVAADVKYARIDEAPRPYFYVPLLQAYRSLVILHSRAAAGASVDALVERDRDRVGARDADLPILSARPLEEQIRGAFIFLDLMATMLLLFGTAGMALAAMGTYGLVSYMVRQSTHEVGIRMALGASPSSVILDFLARGLRLGGIGAALGTLAALAAGGLLRTVLFGVSGTDGTAFARALLLVLSGVAIATLIPAWRAARTSPVKALRHH